MTPESRSTPLRPLLRQWLAWLLGVPEGPSWLLLLALSGGPLFLACGPAGNSTLVAGAGPTGAGATARPNLLLIYVDDLGWGDLGGYGHHTIETPNLDRLAREGMRFTDFYAPSPLCSPSRASLLTGRTPFRTGIENWIPENTDVQLQGQELTLAELLREAGWATHHSGKWHLNGGLDDEEHLQPDDHGFEDWITLHAFALPNHRNPTNIWRNGLPLGEVEGYTAEIFADATLEWLEHHQSERPEQPWFVYWAPPEPHGMIASPPEMLERYGAWTRGAPEPFVNGTAEPSEDLEARGPGEYYANITWLDAQIGRLLDHLDATGQADETVVFFSSDNGPVTTDWRHWWEVNLYGSTGGLRGRKADLWEGGLRVPTIVRWPDQIAAGAESSVPLSGYDVLPTVASLLGVELAGALAPGVEVDGEDFSALLGGGEFSRRRPLYWEFDDDRGMHYALRDGRWKLHANEDLSWIELYDLEQDPFEVLELSARRPQVVERLVDSLREIEQSVAADLLRPKVTLGRPGFRGD